jgi:MoxR-like ATPase
MENMMSEAYLRSSFKNWISTPGKAGEDIIPPDMIDAYVNALKFASSKLIRAKIKSMDLFSFVTIEEFAEARHTIEKASNFPLVDQGTAGAFSKAIHYYGLFLEEITQPACWIFPCSPKVYDIIPAVQELTSIPWKIDSKDSPLKKNDKIYLWIPGVDGGIVAAGTAMSNPEEKDPLKNDPYVIEGNLIFNSFTGIDIRLDRRFTNPLVEKNLFLADENTRNMDFLVFPGASHYLVSPEQEVAMERIIDSRNSLDSMKPVSEKNDESSQTLNPEAFSEIHQRKYWIFAPMDSLRLWDDSYSEGTISLGVNALDDLKEYSSKSAVREMMKSSYGTDRNYKHISNAIWQFANKMQVGDIVFWGNGTDKILGRGIIKSEYIFEKSRKEHRNIRSVSWTHKGEWLPLSQTKQRTLTDITPFSGFCRELEDLVTGRMNSEIGEDARQSSFQTYSKEDFLGEVFMDEAKYDSLRNLLLHKQNIVLTGAPGVGKTFLANRLAYSVMGEMNTDRIRMIRFHAGYSYDDFVMGYRRSANGEKLVTGVFYDFCKEAEPDDREYFFIIDDIDCGNIGSVFGELLTLIDNDRRGESLRLQYRDEQFFVPENVYIIATMNHTADSDLSKDYSLRRRFAFFHIDPAFDNRTFLECKNKAASKKLDKLVKVITNINKAITLEKSDDSLLIGHGYFCGKSTLDDIRLSAIVEYEILPHIRSVWADNPDQCNLWSGKITAAMK